MRVPQHRTLTPGKTGAHSGGADIDHHRDSKTVDGFEEGLQRRIVDREVPHDRMEVKAEDTNFSYRALGFLDRRRALVGIDGTPRLDDRVRMAVAQSRDVLIGARGRAGDRLDVERNHDG